jgi:ATP-dependent Clp protease ATP-binding subunit ClpA
MFERFTKETRAVVQAAASEAALMRSPEVAPEHLLLALRDELIGLGVDGEALRRDVAARDGLDADALATLGIDLGEVRRQAEETFGPGALDPVPGGRRPPFGRGAKKTLELTLREAIALGHRELRPAHVLLALTRDDGAMALLGRHGVDRDAVRAAVTTDYRR